LKALLIRRGQLFQASARRPKIETPAQPQGRGTGKWTVDVQAPAEQGTTVEVQVPEATPAVATPAAAAPVEVKSILSKVAES
jgi:hypothetical protein